MPIPNFYAIIPAGGAGTRLWPLSRAATPKFLLDLTGTGRTLLQATVDRLAPLTEGIVVVTGAKHVAACTEQLPEVPTDNILAEPSPRDSMAAIGLAAAVLQQRHGDVVVGSFAADHVIHGQDTFNSTVAEAVAAANAGYLVTIGIAAPRPATAFGYIETGDRMNLSDAPTAMHVVGFTEKPDAATAAQYVQKGNYRWNAGIFVARTSVLLGHLKAQLPALHDGLLEIAAAWDTPQRAEVLEKVWPHLDRIAIDHAIAEPVAALGGVAVVPGSFAWDDIGDFANLGYQLPAIDKFGNKVLGDAGNIIRVDVGGALVVPGTDRLIALLGLDDVVVVDLPDALLVASRSHAQQVKRMVDAVRDAGYDLL